MTLATPGTDVRSGIRADADLDGDPASFRVTWIDWDSDFRRELRLDDRIVAVNGVSLEPLLRPHQTSKGIGQAAEPQYWAEIGAAAGDEVELTVWRVGAPVAVRGRLGTEMFYYDAEGRRALAPGGPATMSSEGFGSSWGAWLEDLQREMSFLQTRGWTQSVPTRRKLDELLAHRERVDYWCTTWPGPFADTLRADWEATVELMRGRAPDPPIDLEYRTIGEQRAQAVRAAAAAAWSAAVESVRTELVPAYPAADPMAADAVVGKVVELPPITQRYILDDMGVPFAAAGSPGDGWWFVLLDQPAIRELYAVLHRYRGQVSPELSDRFRFLGRILDAPQMFAVEGRAAVGLAVEPIAALAGDDDAVFVDLRSLPARFAGEDDLVEVAVPPRDDTDPASVLTALVAAVKTGDEAGFRALFAPWRALAGGGGRTVVDLSYQVYPGALTSEWEHSRRLLAGPVLDARVGRVEPVKRVVERTPEHGLPDVDQVVVWLDHYGEFDGEHRTFQDVNVHRRWVLQRLDGGPWRIVSVQSV